MLDVSLNEVETLAAKAARGAGLPWGLADETAWAARWLAGLGLAWAPPLASLLAGFELRAIATAPSQAGAEMFDTRHGEMSPLLCGPALTDRANGLLAGAMHLRRVREPLWILPFAARASLVTNRHVQVGFGRILAAVSWSRCWLVAGGFDTATTEASDVVCTSLAGSDPLGTERERSDRSYVEAEAWDGLQAFASRTYVPASDLSRARGAGAGPEIDD